MAIVGRFETKRMERNFDPTRDSSRFIYNIRFIKLAVTLLLYNRIKRTVLQQSIYHRDVEQVRRVCRSLISFKNDILKFMRQEEMVALITNFFIAIELQSEQHCVALMFCNLVIIVIIL